MKPEADSWGFGEAVPSGHHGSRLFPLGHNPEGHNMGHPHTTSVKTLNGIHLHVITFQWENYRACLDRDNQFRVKGPVLLGLHTGLP